MEAAKLQSVVNSLLECCICLDAYQDPRILPCGHTFCLKCIQRNASQVCSYCKAHFSLPATGFQGLPKNFVVESFIASLPSVSLCALSQGKKHGLVEYFCIDCWEPLCAVCCQGHTKFVKTVKNHVIKKMTEINQADVELHNRKKSSKCTKHSNQEVVLYCTECEQVACTVCCVVSHAEHMKKCVSIEELDKTFLAKIREELDNTKRCLTDYDNTIKETEKSIEEMGKQQIKHKNDENETLNSMKRQITEAYQKIMIDIEDCKTTANNAIDEHVKINKIKTGNYIKKIKSKQVSLQATFELLEIQISPLSTPIDRVSILKSSDFSILTDQTGLLDNCQIIDDQLPDLTAWKQLAQDWNVKLVKLLSDAEKIPRLNITNITESSNRLAK